MELLLRVIFMDLSKCDWTIVGRIRVVAFLGNKAHCEFPNIGIYSSREGKIEELSENRG